MATGTYPKPFYRSAVDGLMISTDNNHYRSNIIPKQQIPPIRYPMMTSSIQTSYISQSYPMQPNILRSSTGSMLHRLPNPRVPTAAAAVLRPTNLRWNSGINIVDFRTRPLVSQKKNFQNSTFLSSGTNLTRSESLQLPNTYLINNQIIQKSRFDAKHFCGLPPIHENKLLLKEIPPFRSPAVMSW